MLLFLNPARLLRMQRKLTLTKPFNIEIPRKILRMIHRSDYIRYYISEVLKYIPYMWLTPEIVKNITSGKLIRYIPEDLLTEDVLISYIDSHYGCYASYPGYIPRHLRIGEVAMKLVSKSGDFITYIPREERTMKLIMRAVDSDGDAIKYIPNHMKTREVIEAALIKHGMCALKYVPEYMRTREIEELAVKICSL